MGDVVEKRLFDAWGDIIKVQNGDGIALTRLTFIDRGYTGHEHLQSFRLININGRLYDPKLHRFLQPDNNLQEPYNTQNYNRYGYVLNNPLKYTDPTGEFTWSDLVSGLAIVAGAILVVVGGPAGVLLGYKLIGAGVTHFGATATRLANNGGTWDEASNDAGLNYSWTGKTDFGGGKKDVSNNNNPVESHPQVATGPNTPFDTEKQAAIDFGMNYNSYAILKKTEIITTIYKLNGKYSYVVPLVCSVNGCEDFQITKSLSFVNKIKGSYATASAHLHPGLGKFFTKAEIKANTFDNSLFTGELNGKSSGDISTYNSSDNGFGRRINGYMGNPNGGMNFFDSTQNYTPIQSYEHGVEYKYNTPIFKGLPSDPNVSPYRLNNINPLINSNYPLYQY